ncbi:hypothetical protein B0H34DRAFT_280863 [Crassisporium funariophilum]|nr:hypothetical protein B0H34DRAFT_280863 [Crassisporium funariophilum]
MAWIGDDLERKSFILWLYGPAGAGKSALAQTIAEICQEKGVLAASFFFSRTAERRNTYKHLIATIVYQLTLSIPPLRPPIDDMMEINPSIMTRSTEAQIQSLLIEPLTALSIAPQGHADSWPRMIIVDGLDECQGQEVQVNILKAMSAALVKKGLPLVLPIASRAEWHITHAFNGAILRSLTPPLALDNTYKPDDDIRLLLRDSFNEIKQSHPLREYISKDWPKKEDMQALMNKSSGQFIYAATVVRYVTSLRHQPPERLEVVLKLTPPPNNSGNPFAQLDALYMTVFSSVVEIEAALRILRFCLTPENDFDVAQYDPADKPATPSSLWPLLRKERRPLHTLERNLMLRPGDIQLYLCDLVSLGSPEDKRRVFLHASLGDFLLDGRRSGQYHVNISEIHADGGECCLHHLAKPSA